MTTLNKLECLQHLSASDPSTEFSTFCAEGATMKKTASDLPGSIPEETTGLWHQNKKKSTPRIMNDTMIQAFRQIFRRDLLKLRQEIASYIDDEKLWHTERKISNSAGNLCLHLVGNLNTYIAAELGGMPYVRNRDQEFSLKNVSKDELIGRVEAVIEVVDKTLAMYDDTLLQKEYPVKVFAEKMTTGFFLVHLASHLNYHLGQVNYHRRLIDFKKVNNFANVYPRTFC